MNLHTPIKFFEQNKKFYMPNWILEIANSENSDVNQQLSFHSEDNMEENSLN